MSPSLGVAYAIQKRNSQKGGMEKDRALHSNASDQVPELNKGGEVCASCGGEIPKMSEGGEVEETFDDDSLDLLSAPTPVEDEGAKRSRILNSIFSKKSE